MADPSTRLRTPDSAAYLASASATLSPSRTTVSTCEIGRQAGSNQWIRNETNDDRGSERQRGGWGSGSLTVLPPRPTRRRKGRKTSCARARQSCAYISTTSGSIFSTGTLSPASPASHAERNPPSESAAIWKLEMEPRGIEDGTGSDPFLHGDGTKETGGMTWTSATRPPAGTRVAAAHRAARRLARPSPRTATATCRNWKPKLPPSPPGGEDDEPSIPPSLPCVVRGGGGEEVNSAELVRSTAAGKQRPGRGGRGSFESTGAVLRCLIMMSSPRSSSFNGWMFRRAAGSHRRL